LVTWTNFIGKLQDNLTSLDICKIALGTARDSFATSLANRALFENYQRALDQDLANHYHMLMHMEYGHQLDIPSNTEDES